MPCGLRQAVHRVEALTDGQHDHVRAPFGRAQGIEFRSERAVMVKDSQAALHGTGQSVLTGTDGRDAPAVLDAHAFFQGLVTLAFRDGHVVRAFHDQHGDV